MPINGSKMSASAMPRKEMRPMEGMEMEGKMMSCRSNWCCNGSFGKKILCTLLGVLLVYVIFYLGTLIHNNIRKYQTIGQADAPQRTIIVNGTGKVTANNDIAVTSLGYSNTDKDVAIAQKNNKQVMDLIMSELRRMGIMSKDLTTNYSINPDYAITPDKGQQLKGYRVASNVTVKIRDLSKISSVLSLAGKYGATEVDSLRFTVDDTDNLKNLARQKAVNDVENKAQQLAASLGVKLKAVVAYNEYEGVDYPMPYAAVAPLMKSLSESGSVSDTGPSPEAISAGSKEVSMNVSVTYEIVSSGHGYDRW
jgi:uncharacterized protein